MHCIELWHFRWPWVTFEGHFGDILTVVTLCAQLRRDLLAIAEVSCYSVEREWRGRGREFTTALWDCWRCWLAKSSWWWFWWWWWWWRGSVASVRCRRRLWNCNSRGVAGPWNFAATSLSGPTPDNCCVQLLLILLLLLLLLLLP